MTTKTDPYAIRMLGGQPAYGGPSWSNLSREARIARIREGLGLGLTFREIASVLKAVKADGTVSVGSVSGLVFKNQIKPVAKARQHASGVHTSRAKANAVKSGGGWKPMRFKEKESGELVPELTARQIRALIEEPIIIEQGIGYCAFLIDNNLMITCGEPTGDMGVKRCAKHRGT